MQNAVSEKKQQELSNESIDSSESSAKELRGSVRPRSMTMLKLEWVAERVRKLERIRKQVEAGTYHVDSTLVAKALLGIEE